MSSVFLLGIWRFHVSQCLAIFWGISPACYRCGKKGVWVDLHFKGKNFPSYPEHCHSYFYMDTSHCYLLVPVHSHYPFLLTLDMPQKSSRTRLHPHTPPCLLLTLVNLLQLKSLNYFCLKFCFVQLMNLSSNYFSSSIFVKCM